MSVVCHWVVVSVLWLRGLVPFYTDVSVPAWSPRALVTVNSGCCFRFLAVLSLCRGCGGCRADCVL
eukprot:3296160-Prorocentrum_lima.AAC.1